MNTTEKRKQLTPDALAKKLAGIKALVLDVDGVLTDDHLYVGPDGFEIKKFHIGDGLSIVLSMKTGLEIIILSNRFSPATETRMKDLRIKHVIQQRGIKVDILDRYLKDQKLGFSMPEIAYIGNDIMDIGLAQKAGIGICVSDAYAELKEVVDYVTTHAGGHGAVREIVELYFKGKGLKQIELLNK